MEPSALRKLRRSAADVLPPGPACVLLLGICYELGFRAEHEDQYGRRGREHAGYHDTTMTLATMTYGQGTFADTWVACGQRE